MAADQHLLQPERIRECLGHSLFSANIAFRKTLDSTNLLASKLARQGAPEGTLVLAEKQTSGRGRRGREWRSPGGANLLFSLLLRPPFSPQQAFVLTMTLALAGCEAVKGATGLTSLIKWPNDLYVGRKKLAGILTEFALKANRMEYVVLGLGLNVNWKPPNEMATSLLAETGRNIPRTDLLVGIVHRFEGYYKEVLSGRIEPFYEQWNTLSLIMGKDVEIASGHKKFRGRAARIDYDGSLIIQDEAGGESRIRNGDVSVSWWGDVKGNGGNHS